MKTLTTLKNLGLSFLAIMLFNAGVSGATFTAVASGNWSNSVTWNGTAPTFAYTADNIIIPAGITVTMDNNVTLGGALATLDVEGALTGSSGTYLTNESGTISGAGTITTGYLAFGTSALLTFTGTITTDNMGTAALTLKSLGQIIVNSNLAITSGAFIMETGGTLTLKSGVNLIMSGGELSANGGTLLLTSPYNVTYEAGGTAGAELKGTGLHNITINTLNSAVVTLSGDLTVSGTLTLTAGILALGTSNLTITGDVAASGAGMISSTSASDITFTTSASITGALNFSGTDNAVNNLTVTVGNNNHAQVNGELAVLGSLSLNSGSLNLGTGSKLMLKGNIAAGGSGTISASPTSDIVINTAASPTGGLMFASGGNSINNLNINITNSGTITLGSDLTVNGVLTLVNGHLNIGNNNLMIGTSGSVTGASETSYIITGASGFLTMSLSAGATAVTHFPVGTTDHFYPATAILNSGSTAGNISVNVMQNVYGRGTTGTLVSATQSVVNATWNYKTDIASNLNLNIGVMWSASDEVNSFDRTKAYISHYTNGNWDIATTTSATASGSMYGITRNNIASLSPFAVFDNNTRAGVSLESSNTITGNFAIFPNPANELLYITNSSQAAGSTTYIQITDINGNVVADSKLNGDYTAVSLGSLKAGCYFVKMYDNNSSVVQKFIKM